LISTSLLSLLFIGSQDLRRISLLPTHSISFNYLPSLNMRDVHLSIISPMGKRSVEDIPSVRIGKMLLFSMEFEISVLFLTEEKDGEKVR